MRFILSIDGTAAGRVTVDNNTQEVKDLLVKEGYRNTGIATCLVAIATSNGGNHAYCNEESGRIFKSIGYEEELDHPENFEEDGSNYTFHHIQ